MSDFTHFNLEERILKILTEINYKTPTEIQEAAIPKILSGSDLIASAQTGTGKTGAFMLPILHLLSSSPSEKNNGPQVLILVPTRELAVQVADETKKYSKYLPQVKTVCIYGGVPYPIQKRSLSKPYDILIATPGRLIDHLDQKRIDLSAVKVFVLDEADRMLDMGFIDAVEQIAGDIPKERQTLLFSATIDNKILPFSRKLQKNPYEIRVKQDLSLKDNIETSLYYVDDINHKMRILDYFLETVDMTQMIIFTSTINQTKVLASYLQENDYLAGALHGDMDQRQRTKTINRLRKGTIQILVATDVAARGIDIASLSHVINFDLPFQSEDFVHRIGRTGRAGAKGNAITFATYREDHVLARIYRLIGKPLPVLTIEGMEPKVRDNSSSSQQQRRFGGRSRFNRNERSFDRKPSFKEGGERSFDKKAPFRKEGERSFDRKPSFKEGGERSFDKKAPFRKEGERSFDRKPSFKEGGERSFGQKRTFKKEGERSFDRKPSFKEDGERSFDRKPSFKEGGERSFGKKAPFKKEGERSFDRKPSFKEDGERSFGKKAPFKKEGERSFDRKPSFKEDGERSFGQKRPFRKEGERSFDRKPPFKEGGERSFGQKRPFRKEGERSFDHPHGVSMPKRRGAGTSGEGPKKFATNTNRPVKRNFKEAKPRSSR